MHVAKSFVLLGSLLGACVASAVSASVPTAEDPRCGKINILFTGLPPTHPLVELLGAKMNIDPASVGPRIQADVKNIVDAGYNIMAFLAGPEVPLDGLAQTLQSTRFDGVGIGYGVRGPPVPEITIRLEDTVDLFRRVAPQAPIMFNYSPDTAEWAIKRRFPLNSNCTSSPGKILGIKTDCKICKQS